MANIQVSVWISEELVGAADDVAEFEKRSRNYVLSGWLRDGAKSAGVEDVGEEAQEIEKKSDVSGRGKNPKRVGRVPEEMVERGTALERSVDTPWVEAGVAGVRLVRVEDMHGRVLTKEEVEAAGFGELKGPVDIVLPGPVFRTDAYLTKPENDFPVVGFTEEMLEKTDAQKKQELSYPDSPDPVSGSGVVYPLMPLPPAIAAEAGRIMKAAETIEVPEAAVTFAKHLRDKVEAFTGADPQTLNATEKPHARTLQGAEAAEAHRDAKRKKIASIPASPTPGKSQEKKYVKTQSASKETQKNRKEDQPSQRQSTQTQSESQPPTGTGQRLDGHDPKTCKVYGCLMCQSLKKGNDTE